MLTFLLTNAIARKVAIGALVILAIGYALRRYSNRVYDEGYRSGKVAGMAEAEKAKLAEWKAKTEAIAADAAKVAEDQNAVAAAAVQLSQDRSTVGQQLKSSLESIRAERTKDYARVAGVSASDLDGAIRSVSADLAAASAK